MAYASADGVLTLDMIDEKVNDAVEQHQKKVLWQQEQGVKEEIEIGKSYVSGKADSPTILSKPKPS